MAITVKSAFWNDSYSFIRGVTPLRKVVARLLERKELRRDRQLLNVLLGTVPGTTATSTLKRVQSSTSENGGLRPIETETIVGRASTAADDTELTTQLLTYNSRPTYPADRAKSW